MRREIDKDLFIDDGTLYPDSNDGDSDLTDDETMGSSSSSKILNDDDEEDNSDFGEIKEEE